ncbi:hypothetical protein SK128_014604 [Halocaridina rubra]|uniref:VWFD domain-containing protein n=1 Tax=Halocaridina rubra TaxID=373956 RepID=A0AAN8WKH4_HALRR
MTSPRWRLLFILTGLIAQSELACGVIAPAEVSAFQATVGLTKSEDYDYYYGTDSPCEGIPCGEFGICQTNCSRDRIVGKCDSNNCFCCLDGTNATTNNTAGDGNCTYNGHTYPSGQRLQGICIHMICRNGKWYSGGYINSYCETCSVFDDPHFNSFDGLWFDFHGICNYSVTQEGVTYDPPFGIYGKFRRCYPSVGCIDIVTFKDNANTVITVKYNMQNIIQVNGVSYTVTYTVQPVMEGAITHPVLAWRVNNQCSRFLGTQGLLLEFCWYYGSYSQFYVYAYPSLVNKLYGLCGTFNYIKNDDLTLRNLTVASHVNSSCPDYTPNNNLHLKDPQKMRQLTVDSCNNQHYNTCYDLLSALPASEEHLEVHSTFCATDACAISQAGEDPRQYFPSILAILNTTVEHEALSTPGGVPPDELICSPCGGTCGDGATCKYECDSTEEETMGNCTATFCKCCRKKPTCENSICGKGGTCRSCGCLQGEERIPGICPLRGCDCCKLAPVCPVKRCGRKQKYRCKSKNICLKRTKGKCKSRDCTCCRILDKTLSIERRKGTAENNDAKQEDETI